MIERSPDTLFIGGSFFGYSREIIARLEASGRKVLWFDDRPSSDAISKAILRLSPKLLAGKMAKHLASIESAVSPKTVRDVLIIKGEGFSPEALARLREVLPSARFTLYFWDSYKNMPADSRKKVDICDRSFTFDPDDALADPRLTYRPLFYVDEYAGLAGSPVSIDLLFIGTMHSDRYRVIEKLGKSLAPALKFHRFMYFPARFVFDVRRVVDPQYWGASLVDFSFSPLDRSEVLRLVAGSRAVLDIERPVQRGLTMRTIEVLGSARKLITTNRYIEHADFYDPQNIAVIDRKRPSVPAAFWDTPYRPPSKDVVLRYSLSTWLGDVLPSEQKRVVM